MLYREGKIMPKDNYRNLDLNLLKSFSVTYQERNLKRAAARLNISAPAVSQSMKRLKDHLGQELFVKTPKGYDATPFADALYDGIQPMLDGLSEVINLPDSFEPSQVNDFITFALGQHLIPWLSPYLFSVFYHQCPNATFSSQNISHNTSELLRSGQLDMAIDLQVKELPTDIIAISLSELEFVMIVRKDHPLKQKEATIEELIEYDLALVELPYFNKFHDSKLENILQKRGLFANVKHRTASIIGIKEVLENSDLVSPATVNFVEKYSNDLRGVKVTNMPELSQLPIFAYIHERNRNSLKHKWFLEVINQGLSK